MRKQQQVLVLVLLIAVLVWRYVTFITLDVDTQSMQVTITKWFGVMGAIMAITGVIISFIRPGHLALIFSLYCLTMGLHWGYFPQIESHETQLILQGIYFFISIFMGSFLLHFLLILIGKKISSKWLAVIYFPAFIGLILLVTLFLDPSKLSLLQVTEVVLVTLYGLVGYTYFIVAHFRSGTISKVSSGWVVWGILIGNVPYILSQFLSFMEFSEELGTQPYSLLFLVMIFFFAQGVRKSNR